MAKRLFIERNVFYTNMGLAWNEASKQLKIRIASS